MIAGYRVGVWGGKLQVMMGVTSDSRAVGYVGVKLGTWCGNVHRKEQMGKTFGLDALHSIFQNPLVLVSDAGQEIVTSYDAFVTSATPSRNNNIAYHKCNVCRISGFSGLFSFGLHPECANSIVTFLVPSASFSFSTPIVRVRVTEKRCTPAINPSSDPNAKST
jgi:hypothetical protein